MRLAHLTAVQQKSPRAESSLVTHRFHVYEGEVHSSDTFNGIGQPTSKRVSGTHRDLRPSYTGLSSSQHSLPRCVSLFRLSRAKRTSSFAFPTRGTTCSLPCPEQLPPPHSLCQGKVYLRFHFVWRKPCSAFGRSKATNGTLYC